MEEVVLVDEHDRELGAAEKLSVHETGQLHRAISVFVMDGQGRMLVQQRALDKYHSAGLFSNTCCSHPRPGEPAAAAAHRRLQEEMGFDCPLTPLFTFIYRADFGDGLIEHELDHVFVGQFDGEPRLNPSEVASYRWQTPADLLEDMEAHPESYTYWFRHIIRRVLKEMAA